MKIYVIGGGFVTAAGHGSRSGKQRPALAAGLPAIPKGKEIFSTPLTRYGRFDRYTKLGCAGIALAVRDAGLDNAEEKRPVGIVVSTAYESYSSDLAFYETTREANGAFTSPNLFSYTLPGIVLGEMAIHFKMTGPTIITGEADNGGQGLAALQTAADILQTGLCDTAIAGWLDSPPEFLSKEEALHGSVFSVLTLRPEQAQSAHWFESGETLRSAKGTEITSVLDLF